MYAGCLGRGREGEGEGGGGRVREGCFTNRLQKLEFAYQENRTGGIWL
jgi:hypothetical protein